MLSKSYLYTFKNWGISYKTWTSGSLTSGLATLDAHSHIATADYSAQALFQCLQGLLPSVTTQVVELATARSLLSTVTTSHTWLFEYKLIQILFNYN